MSTQKHPHPSWNKRHNPPQNHNNGANSSQGDILFGVSFSDSSSELKFDDSPVSKRPNQERHQIDQEDPGSPCPDDSCDTSPCRSISDDEVDIPPLNIKKQSTSAKSLLASSSPRLRRISSHRIGSGSSRSSIPRADSPTLPLGSSRSSIPRADSPTLPPETGDSEDSDPDIKLIKTSSEAAKFSRGKSEHGDGSVSNRSFRERARSMNLDHLPVIVSDSDVTDIDSCPETEI